MQRWLLPCVAVALAADPAWPPADRCSVPGFAALSAQCSALTASVPPIVVTKRDVGGFDNVNMSALDTLDEARAVLKGTSAVNAMKGMRSESTEYYNSSLANMMITFCYLTSTAEDLDRCVPLNSPHAQRNKGNFSNTCMVIPGDGSCASKNMCERLPNCLWPTADPTKPRLPRFTKDQIDAANRWVTESYAQSLAPYAGPGIAFAVLTFLGFLLFFIMRCFCNRCGGRDPVERGYTWCGVMTPGVAFFIFSVVIFICSAAAYVQNNTVTARMHDLLDVLTEVITNLNMNSKNLLTPLRAIQDLQGITTAQVQSVLADTSWVGTGARQLQAIGENFDATYTSGFPTTCIQNGDLCLTCPGVICGGTSVAPKTTLTAWRDIADQLESTFRMTRETVYTGATTVFSAADDAEDALTIVATATSDSGATVASVQATFDNISYTRSGLVLSIFILGLFVAFLGMAGFLKGICKDKTKWVHLLHVSWGLGVILCIISFVVASCLIAVSAVWFDGCQYLDMVMNDMTPYFSAETSRVVGACIKGTSTLAALGMASMHAKSCEITERYRVAKQLGMMARFTSLSALGMDIMSYNETQFGWDPVKHYDIVNAAATAIGSDMTAMANYAVLDRPWTLFNEAPSAACTSDADPALCYMKVRCTGGVSTPCYTLFQDALVYTRARNSIQDKLMRMRQDFLGGVSYPNSVGWKGGDKSVLELSRAYAQRLEKFVTTTLTPMADLNVWTQVNALQCTGAPGCGWINEEYAIVHTILCQDLLGACLNIALSVFMNALFLLPMAVCGIVLQKRLRAIRGGTYGAMEPPAGGATELTGRQKLEKKLEALTKGQTTTL
ncbi:hypothetical protein H310_08486 [Aphanomyces invadans]|uniref:Transmembrane protein n=1 Tax=Aphanomyces invadans TaxID=157072 RepID=A0A024TYC6_9STRA|nr:hypothetical protein H310_08486 [Aphanomyces invadans]ETV99013.1 hypothetical protein H310_08486 [Aphanomyces invadans]|eukprot:XP_008872441.1 hypothetical protein H310_08486 [Aphanomyces invadans]